MLAGQHLAGEVDGERSFPHAEIQVGHRGVAVQEVGVGECRVVVEYVEPAELVDHTSDGTDDARLLGQVDGDGQCITPGVPDTGGHPLGPSAVDVEHGHRGTLPSQCAGSGGPDAPGATGDHGHLAGNPPLARVGHLRTSERRSGGTGRNEPWTWIPLGARVAHDRLMVRPAPDMAPSPIGPTAQLVAGPRHRSMLPSTAWTSISASSSAENVRLSREARFSSN